MAKKQRNSVSRKFCRCIKKVRKTIKARPATKRGKESAAIGVCVRSVLGSRGKTLYKFTCRGRKPRVITQPPLRQNGGGCACSGMLPV
jgi:hypothetical protein